MARRRRTGAAEDIIDLTAQLPWWAGVVLALVLYVVLHRLSATVATLAGIGQYLLPLLCLIGAAADGERFLVQCKHWKAYKVDVSVVRELFGLMAAKGAAGGFVVTSGPFTQEAKDFAAGRNIRLVDGEALFALIQSVRKTGARPAAALQEWVRLPAANTPACPLCGEAMVRRPAKRGSNVGQVFWGCSRFPRCRGIRQMGK
jgi:hypothetical protein